MYESVEIWTLFGGEDKPEFYNQVHEIHLSGSGVLIVCFKNGDQLGIPLNTVRRWKLKKATKE